jgi:hypothetical protein
MNKFMLIIIKIILMSLTFYTSLSIFCSPDNTKYYFPQGLIFNQDIPYETILFNNIHYHNRSFHQKKVLSNNNT